MKRKNREQLEREQRLCVRRTRKRLKRQARRVRSRRSVVIYPRRGTGPVIIRAPAVFNIENEPDRSDVLKFLQRLREIVLLEKRDVRISFMPTRRMIAHGTLLFTAELHRILRWKEVGQRISCSYPWNNKVEQVLQQIGVLKLLRKPERLIPDAEDVIHWQFIDGTKAEGEKANRLIELFADKLPDSLSKGLYNGLVEAMTNCVHHAYLEPRNDQITAENESGWWMFAQERDSRLMVAFCDLGIGIPRSLPRTHDPTLITDLLEKAGRALGVKGYRDVDYVAAAFEVGKTRTADTHRGLGLKEFREVVETASNGTLRIFSNKGCYTFRASQYGDPAETRQEFNGNIFGTLIQWSLPLEVK